MKITMIFAAAAAATALNAQILTPETGVANDHGQKPEYAPIHVAYEPRTAETGYGYDDGMTVVGFTILPWALPNSSWDVHGVRFNFGWGRHREMIGLDTGLFGVSEHFSGIAATIAGNYSLSGADGLIVGGVNVAEGRVRGLQIGFVNYAGELKGVQIGLLNFNASGIVFPLLNIGF